MKENNLTELSHCSVKNCSERSSRQARRAALTRASTTQHPRACSPGARQWSRIVGSTHPASSRASPRTGSRWKSRPSRIDRARVTAALSSRTARRGQPRPRGSSGRFGGRQGGTRRDRLNLQSAGRGRPRCRPSRRDLGRLDPLVDLARSHQRTSSAYPQPGPRPDGSARGQCGHLVASRPSGGPSRLRDVDSIPRLRELGPPDPSAGRDAIIDSIRWRRITLASQIRLGRATQSNSRATICMKAGRRLS